MHKKYIIIAFGIFITILPVFILPFMPDRISEFYYRELTYTKIANEYSADDDITTLKNLFEFVAKNHDSSSDYKVFDKNSFIDAIRGVGWCDQQAFLLMNLLNKISIDKTRLRDVQAHTFSEVLIDNKWTIVDPYFGFMPYNERGYIGVENINTGEIKDIENVIISSKKYGNNTSFGNVYKKIYVPNEVRWKEGIGPNFINYRSYNLVRRVIELYGLFAYFLFGDSYYEWVQNHHLQSNKVNLLKDHGIQWITNYAKKYKNNDEAFRLFYKARNYNLTNHTQNAYLLYTQIIDKFQESYWALESKYYLALLEYNQENYIKSEKILSDLLLNSSVRTDHVMYYLGLISLKNGMDKEAINYFSQSGYYYSMVELQKFKSN